MTNTAAAAKSDPEIPHDPDTGEVTGDVGSIGSDLMVLDTGTLATLTRAEVDAQIATAKRYPRDLHRVRKNILTLATLDPETADECMYALPRGGKPIVGPSVRFAEILFSQWGNLRVGARIINIDRQAKHVEAEGICHDLETNSAKKATVFRRITDKHGRLLSEDMILVTCNAATAIASRNAILACVPKPVWRQAYMAVEGIVKGGDKTIAERWTIACKQFAQVGVTGDQLLAALDLAGETELNVDHFPILTGMRSALKSGEETIETLFPRAGTGPRPVGVVSPLANKAGPKKVDEKPAAAAAAGEGAGAPAGEAVDQAAAGDKGAPAAAAEDLPAGKVGKTHAAALAATVGATVAASGGGQDAAAEAQATDTAAEGAKAAPASTAAAGDLIGEQTEEERLAAARKRGEEAAKRGMRRTATPTEYRETPRVMELAAYLEGFDAAKAAIKAAAETGGGAQ